jgi:threonylcarbamoyladenosine tRNA methylthiotransferase MtaB
MKQVLHQIEKLGQLGYKEVVLTGIHIGCYGQDLAKKTQLYDLLCRIRESGAIDRVRVSSIEPAELSNEIIELAAEKEDIPGRLCPHFHVPLQSGHNDILKRMHRPYTKEYFSDLVFRIAERIPDAAIGVDTLIGFPGETDEAFNQTFELIRSLPIAYLHVFPFSPRKATPAYAYKNQIHPALIKDRCKRMRQLGQGKRSEFYEQYMDNTLIVLVEETRDKTSGRLKGLTDNYIPICFDGPDDWYNTFQRVKILRGASEKIPVGIRSH